MVKYIANKHPNWPGNASPLWQHATVLLILEPITTKRTEMSPIYIIDTEEW